jgi:SAM-dependent methyltransferase
MNRPPDFNRIAGLYQWMEMASFGPWLWWCRCAFLGDLGECRRALILGDGDGRFTARLLRVNRGVRADAVDASSAMLRGLARRAGAESDRLRIHLADIRCRQPADPPYDLVVTHFFLDCLTTDEVESMATRIGKAVSPGALWVVSEFDVPAGWFGRLVAGWVIAVLYWAFGRLTGLKVRRLPDYRSGLRKAGFKLRKRRAWLGGLLVSELWAARTTEIPVNPT